MNNELKQKYLEIIKFNWSKIGQIFKEYKKTHVTKPKKTAIKLLIFLLLFTIFGPLILLPAIAIMVFLYDEFVLVKVITNIVLILIVLLPIWILIRLNKKNKKTLQYEEQLYPIIKNEILLPLLNDELVGFDYEHSRGIDVYTFIQASLNERYDRFYSNDYIKFALCDNHIFEISNVLTETEETDDEGRTYYATQFRGLVGKTTLPININAKVEISSLKGDKNKISLDMDHFEKYFEVTSNDEIKALQVLTHDIMLKLIEIRERYNIKYDLVISNDNMYIRLYNNTLFEIRRYENLEKEMYKDIEKLFNVKNIVLEILNVVSSLVI